MTTVAVDIPKIIPLEHPAVLALAKWLAGYETSFHDAPPWDKLSELDKDSWEMFAATTMNEVVTPALVEGQGK